MRNRAPIIILLAVFIVFALMAAGCAAAPDPEDGSYDPFTETSQTDANPYTYNTDDHTGVDEYLVTLSDGRTVICLFQSTAGAPSCDWEHVGTTNEEDSE